MANKDVFSSLYRWAYRQGENFTTEAFVFLLNELRDRDPAISCALLNWLCFDGVPPFCASNPPIICPWSKHTGGTPDIRIEGSNELVLVEVKKGSDLHQGQLAAYRSILKNEISSAGNKSLVLLTAYHATFGPHEEPDVWKRWGDVEEWLGKRSSSDPVAKFLIDQFRGFLRGEGMALNRVEWQYYEGVKSLISLTDMLQQALRDANVPTTQTSTGWGWRGDQCRWR